MSIRSTLRNVALLTTLLTASIVTSSPGAAFAAAQTCSEQPGGLPDPMCTPGALNPDVTPSTIDTTICVGGYSGSIRPSSSFTNKLKAKQMIAYGRDGSLADYEEDHMINLSLGGSPTSPRNLWPQARNGTAGTTAGDKDVVEFKLYRAVCAGKAGLREAQKALVSDWTTALASLGL
jgi:hypothetical protein